MFSARMESGEAKTAQSIRIGAVKLQINIFVIVRLNAPLKFFEDGSMEINGGNERRPNLVGPIYFPGLKPPKEDEKVRVHGYYINGPTGDFVKMIATKIEKVGEA